jgi:hypothetical protein
LWSRRYWVSPFCLGAVYVGLGDVGRALDCLEQAVADRDPLVNHLHLDPRFHPLRREPRYQSVVPAGLRRGVTAPRC